MAVVVKDREATAPVVSEQSPGHLFDPGERALDELVTAVWDGLAARGSACCLVCGETLSRPNGSEAAECGRCGSLFE